MEQNILRQSNCNQNNFLEDWQPHIIAFSCNAVPQQLIWCVTYSHLSHPLILSPSFDPSVCTCLCRTVDYKLSILDSSDSTLSYISSRSPLFYNYFSPQLFMLLLWWQPVVCSKWRTQRFKQPAHTNTLLRTFIQCLYFTGHRIDELLLSPECYYNQKYLFLKWKISV